MLRTKRAALVIFLTLSLALVAGAANPDKTIIVLTTASNGTTLNVTGVMWFTITTGSRPR